MVNKPNRPRPRKRQHPNVAWFKKLASLPQPDGKHVSWMIPGAGLWLLGTCINVQPDLTTLGWWISFLICLAGATLFFLGWDERNGDPA